MAGVLALTSLTAIIEWTKAPKNSPTPTRATAEAEVATRRCTSKARSELQGPVARWQLTDETPEQQGVTLTYAADVDGKAVTYRCEVTSTGITLAALDDP